MSSLTSEQPFHDEISSGVRFAFGRNWRRFLGVVDERRIELAEQSLTETLEKAMLDGLTFLDIGCGSGLFSLAAARLGASRVHSFDYDPNSVACARELKARYLPEAPHWTIERGSVLDANYLSELRQWDIVYSWGVLHHTGQMWQALDNVTRLVAPGGSLYISIYNDQGRRSTFWIGVKKFYNRAAVVRPVLIGGFGLYLVVRGLIADVVRLRLPFRRYRYDGPPRGMSAVHDWVDWLGGYPFEVAKPERVFDWVRARGFTLVRLTTVGGSIGCNEFVFRRE